MVTFLVCAAGQSLGGVPPTQLPPWPEFFARRASRHGQLLALVSAHQHKASCLDLGATREHVSDY